MTELLIIEAKTSKQIVQKNIYTNNDYLKLLKTVQSR